METFLFPTLNTVFLLVIYSVSFASSSEHPLIGNSAHTQPQIGSAYMDSSFPSSFAQEVSLWPEGSKVLEDGIKIIANDEYAKNNPRLVITHPTFLLYTPKKHSARAAVIVFPGGGYKGVAIGKKSTIGFNGADVCKWLTGAGATCILLKYRVPNSGCSWNAKTRKHDTPDTPMALQDAQRTISIVRYNAKKYDIDPNKIGVMGFSAGGNLAVLSSTAFKKRAYDPIDEIDQVSSRPDFAIPVYPGHLTMEHKNKKPKEIAAQELNTDIEISTDIPPTLLIHAKDDPIDPVHYSKVYERELKKVGVNVKLMLYQTGGHAFGVKKQGKDTDRWTVDALRWLKEIKIL
ncbi:MULTISPECIES: alpha/beta hydrolase [unclassified Microbulbifer]|uniref:alpha/beta hydrolase n=1 Tax=unclassified Microbulbifer TaxID=2619833 RepID=UPI0027E59152|nr:MULTISPECIES: alpha/beta hydrolase [unclassified Microbulbifer]